MNIENQKAEAAIPDRLSPERLPFVIQADLILRSDRTDIDWVKINSGKFREIIKNNPDLFDRYLKDKETTLVFIEQQLKGEETIH